VAGALLRMSRVAQLKPKDVHTWERFILPSRLRSSDRVTHMILVIIGHCTMAAGEVFRIQWVRALGAPARQLGGAHNSTRGEVLTSGRIGRKAVLQRVRKEPITECQGGLGVSEGLRDRGLVMLDPEVGQWVFY